MGFEIEFCFLNKHSNLVRSVDPVTGHSCTARLWGENLGIMEEVVTVLEISGINVYGFHTENADQLEVSLSRFRLCKLSMLL
jgi:glutamine synthetase